ncbi:hypothetical protein GCM10010517_14050 [Streptosporangium fragile]|uniref:Cysteine dioxygenase n=1 Tax=Streptosporangium fragile TaxID=46186 RepID=A0ABN3VV82_9ACTN
MSNDAFDLIRSALRPISAASVADVGAASGPGRRELLRELIALLRADDALVRSMVERSYKHPNGFDRISLFREPDGLEARIHLWERGVPSDEGIHNHAWDFSSLVLTGALRFQILQQTADGETYDLYRSGMPRGGRFGDYEFTRLGTTSLGVVFDGTVSAGSAYHQHRDAYHRVLVSPEQSMTATIVVRGPVRRGFSHVVVPRGTSMPRTRSMRHLGGEEIIEKLCALLSRLSEE